MAARNTAFATRKSVRRRDEILRRATELFDRKGYANTSLDDIARAVGISREGIYYYFRNRSEILLGIIKPQSVGLVEGLEAIVDRQDVGFIEKLRLAIRNHLERFDRHCLEMTVSLRDGTFEDAAVREEMQQIWKSYETMWTRLIRDGQGAGQFHAEGEPKMLAFGILGMCNWLARWYDPRKPATIEALIDAYFGVAAYGLVGRPSSGRPEAAKNFTNK